MNSPIPHEGNQFSQGLDALRRTTSQGAEYWHARDLLERLGYSRWEGFVDAIERAQRACESTNVPIANHFRKVTKKVAIGSGAMANREDFILSRYGCYLVAMNGDTRKPEIGFAQSYFAVQTRRRELADEAEGLDRRLELRARVKGAGIALNAAAKTAGVQNYASFHDAGYRGLYGDLHLKQIKARKGIAEKDELYDRASRGELAANEFRLTQAEEKLTREGITGEYKATTTHFDVGRQVRDAIKRIGGTMPENMPAEPSLKILEKAARRLAKNSRSRALSYSDGQEKSS